MARRSTAADRTAEDDSLYTEPIRDEPEQDADSGDRSTATGGGDESPGESGSGAPFGLFPDGRPRKRKPRARTSAPPPERSAPSVHTRAQIRGLAKSISLSAQAAFDALAVMRTMTLGMVPDMTSPVGVVMKPDGTPMGAGEVWKLDPKEGMQLGEAWAEVIALYCPPELVERSAVVSTAVVTTGMVLGTRLFADIQMQTLIKQVNMIRSEGLPHTPSNMAPNGTAPFPHETAPYEPARVESDE